ncbi:flagellar basal body P-ring protein FlgI [Alkalimarinus alittae]|uniref:Flagellar P-ring protein n=1 Tax=Alkalimarinus alittae TaxID=2961619 RepID=A0ABY6N6E6_9ALTE|nr:flagellar basal body P-ring protein FlgI [Alkalimarinus alittae]UZE97688.1 flagellar basal body P-ring protein FlgI [Alkalimarinus alittae]
MNTLNLFFYQWRSLIVMVGLLVSLPLQADRLKDLASVQGVRSNQLIGYGLVVGLDGSGDKAPFTDQTFRNLMNKFGITIPQGSDPKLKNVAAVTVHAELPAFAKPGQTVDITVSSIGNAKSLRGGSLLMTPLKGADGKVYAMAQGSLVVGGFGAEGADGSSITVNVPSVGRIPNGASVERSVPSGFHRGDTLTFNMHIADFTTVKRVVDKLNDLLGPQTAYAMDGGSVSVKAPRDASQRVSFLSVLENIEIEPGEGSAKVIINSRTGTIVVGQNVKVLPAAVTHGSLSVTISEGADVVQPGAFAGGETAVVPRTEIDIEQEPARMFKFGPAITLNEIVQAVNQVGAAPGDIMAILEALKTAGALKAELIVI